MKIEHATIRDVTTRQTTRSFTTEKGYAMTYEAGMLSIRHERFSGKVAHYTASNIVEMWTEAETPKKK